MKIIILAAGKGTRLMPLTQNTPKPLLHLKDGKTLLETQIDNIISSGVIDEIIVVVGYKAEQIKAKIKNYEKTKNIKITVVCNPFYNVSNNLLSLWLARYEMDFSFLVTNGDNIFDKQVFIDLVTRTGDGINLTTTKIEKFNADDMKVIEKNGYITKVSKKIIEEEASGESVGLVKISGESYINAFKDTLDDLATNEEYINVFWLEVFNRLAEKAVIIKPFEINRNNWLEFDFHIDLETARCILEKNIQGQTEAQQLSVVQEKKESYPKIWGSPL